MTQQSTPTGWARWVLLVAFAAAFAYIESAVVVYLRAIFYPDGFVFPIADLASIEGAVRFFWTEVGREAATMVLIITAAGLMTRSWRHRVAYVLLIFALWDFFYYVWLKMLVDWPASLLDWDILFLIPGIWAGPVLAPLLSSSVMLWIAWHLLAPGGLVIPTARWVGLGGFILGIVVCYCLPGPYIGQPDYASHFSWPLFVALHAAVVVLVRRSRL